MFKKIKLKIKWITFCLFKLKFISQFDWELYQFQKLYDDNDTIILEDL